MGAGKYGVNARVPGEMVTQMSSVTASEISDDSHLIFYTFSAWLQLAS